MNVLTRFIIIFNFLVSSSLEKIPPTSGFYTDGIDKVLDQYEIVYPEKVSKDGSFVSYYIPHYYNIESMEYRPRRTKGSSKDEIHFFVPIGGEKQHLKLWPNWNFLASNLVIERRDARDVQNINKAKINQVSQRQCHYSGEIVGKPNSSAALSTCYGLAGFIREPEGEEYLIEPLKDTKPIKGKEHPHIIYKRSGKKSSNSKSNCHTNGDPKEALAERLQWEAMFGDLVRKETAGVNMNELVTEDRIKTPSHSSFKKVSQTFSFGDIVPQAGKFDSNNEPEDRSKNYNYLDMERPQQVYQNIPKSNLHEMERTYKNKIYSSGGKLKPKFLKVESNMGSIKLPDGNLETVKALPNKMFPESVENGNFETDHHKTKRCYEHKRSKRYLVENNFGNSDDFKLQEGIDYDTNIKTNLADDKQEVKQPNEISQKSNIKSVETSDVNEEFPKTSNEEIRNQGTMNCETKNIQNSMQDDRKDSHSTEKQNGKFLDKREYDKETKNSPYLVDSKSVDENKDGFQKNYQNKLIGCPLSNGKQNKIDPLKTDENGNSNKRDIHLDASEKSWQSNESPEKLKIKLEKPIKDLKDEESVNKLSDGVAGSSSQKDFSKGSENYEEHQTFDDKTAKSNIKEVDKAKVKKEISFDQSNEKTANDPNFLDTFSNPNHDKYIKFNQIPSAGSPALPKNCDDFKLLNDKQNLVFLTKESSAGAGDGEKESEVKIENQAPSRSIKSNENSIVLNKDSNIETVVSVKQEPEIQFSKDCPNNKIVIEIETPQGTISEVKKNNVGTNNKILQEDNTVLNVEKSEPNKLENQKTDDNLLKTPVESLDGDLNKLGVLDKLEKNNFLQDDNYFSGQKQPNFVEKGQTINNNVKSGIKNSQIKTGNGKNIKIKRKRDDSLHIVYGNDPAINSQEIVNANANPKRDDLFCKGQNCLDIKAFIINDNATTGTSPNSKLSNNFTDVISAKVVEKRQAWDECVEVTTTEKHMLCNDFYSRMFYLEIMVTVDYKVFKLHEDSDIENFIFTIINMVSTNFYDRTIGINLSIYLVRLIILTTCIKELDSDRFDAEELLENFCTWQTLINPASDEHPHHHDLAILVTRMEKCEGKVLGAAYMTGVCRPDKACVVCVDEGLLLANTITHQIGHALGAGHDESESCGCSETNTEGIPYHMAPGITESSSSWSICSRDSISQFMKTQGSWCLSDTPVDKQFNNPLILPGQIYSAPQQCKLNFHMNALPCSIGAFCERLYCQVTDKLCASKGDPPADGTFCAADMWCFHKQCVHVGRRPGAVNGEWGPWTEWSLCTRSCGGGVSTSYRTCNRPKPENGGRYCVGDRIRHRMCSVRACSGFTESFRDLQCKKTEDRPFRGRLHNWMTYQSYFLNIHCALICQNRKGDIVMRSPVVADGTPCKPGTRNVCIQGSCRSVGCDWVIDSNARDDACGVCQGNGTECKIIQGAFMEETTGKGMVEFLRLPKGSGMIFVREIAPSSNIVAVSGSINKVFYLNGEGAEDSMPGDIALGKAHGVYEVRSRMERIFIKGPIEEELVFYLRFREQNKGIHYQYAVPEIDLTYVARYLWQYLDWEPCTAPCSGGSQRAHAKCVEDRGGLVDDQYCTESSRPLDIIRPCNDFPCQAKWWVSVWSDCICMGCASLMFRSVLCMRATDESGFTAEVVKESECADFKKPPTQKPCNASEEDECAVKRSISQRNTNFWNEHKYLRRAVDSQLALSPAEPSSFGTDDVELFSTLSEHSSDDKKAVEQSGSNKNQKKSVKVPANKNIAKETESKAKTKISEKESSHDDKKKLSPSKQKEDNSKAAVISKPDNNKESKSHLKDEDALRASEKGKQIAKLKSKVSVPLKEVVTSLKGDSNKQGDDTSDDTKEDAKDGDNCETTTPLCATPPPTTEAICPTETPPTPKPSTCRPTLPPHPHKKTTCCKTLPRVFTTRVICEDTTRPMPIMVDEIHLNNFGLTIIPLDFHNSKKLPQTDPEYINLGNIGQFNVGHKDNASIITGQEAIDFLEFVRNNATDLPVILHEDMHGGPA